MKQPVTIEIKVHVRWWVGPYIKALALFAIVTGQQPDLDRIGKFIAKHGVKLELK